MALKQVCCKSLMLIVSMIGFASEDSLLTGLSVACRYVQMDEEDAARELGVDMERDVVTCEVPFGSVLFLNNIIPHR